MIHGVTRAAVGGSRIHPRIKRQAGLSRAMRRVTSWSPSGSASVHETAPLILLYELSIVLARVFGQPAPAPLADAHAGGV
jgi:hypothetical protein